MALPAEVFLSHATPDEPFASEIAETLRRHGIPVWYSITNAMGAQQWRDEIGAALNRCDWFLLTLSPASVASMWVKRELVFALQQRRYEAKIVPILYQSCQFEDLSWVLPSLQIVNFTQGTEDGYRQLLRIWGIGYAHP